MVSFPVNLRLVVSLPQYFLLKTTFEPRPFIILNKTLILQYNNYTDMDQTTRFNFESSTMYVLSETVA